MGRLIRSRMLAVTAAAALAASASLTGAGVGAQDTTAPPERLPRRVEYTGTMTLDRRAHDACQTTVPPVLTADVTLVVDLDAGTVTGGFTGSASGRYVMPGSCSGANDTSNDGYEATTSYSATITGSVDAATGAIAATAAVTIEGSYDYGWLPGMPEYDDYITYGGGRTCGGTPGLSAYCSVTIDPRAETATITGRLLPTAAVELAIDWYTLVCELVTFDGNVASTRVTPEGCVTAGSFDLQPGAVVWPRNDAPVIDSFSVSPPEPDTNMAITATVTATDVDGDALTYVWTVDGAAAGSGPSVTIGPLPGGDHVVAVRVSDPAGEADEESALVRVFEADVADRDGDGVGDLDDACPDEPGSAPDGCPKFAVSLGCAPARPMPAEPVSCAAEVIGARTGESLLLEWYLDGASVQSGPAAAWQWPAAVEGEHAVLVDVVGEGRSASASTGLEVVGGEVTAEQAGFSLAGLGCNSGISSDEILTCSIAVARQRDDVGALVVTWRVDGQTALVTTIQGASSAWSLDRPAPGQHLVGVTVVDPVTNFAQSASTEAAVRRGSNTSIPPDLQALAAGATVLTIGAWLWLELIDRSRAEAAAAAAAAEAEPPPRSNVPSWVNDPRPLVEIWASEAAAEALRHGYTDVRWYAELNAFVPPDYRTPEQIEQLQRGGRDRWHQLVTTLDGAPGLTDLAAFVHAAEPNVVLPDGTIDLAALDRLQAAVDRLGQLDLATGRIRQYTNTDAAWDTLSQAVDNPAVRIGASVLLSPLVDPFLQAMAMTLRSEQMVQAGISDADIRRAMTNELVLYGGMSVIGNAGGQLIAANSQWLRSTAAGAAQRVLTALPDDVATAVSGAGQRALTTLQQLGHAGATDVTTVWERGLSGTWQRAGNLTRVAQLASSNAALGSAVDDLYRSIDEVGASRSITPGLSLSSLEQRALDLLRSDPAGYQQAVRSGLIPIDVHRTVNWARDKIVKQAISQTFDDLGNQKWLIDRVDITGTGANPLSSRATSGWTDVDLTAIGTGADRNFQRAFNANLDAAFGAPNAGEALDVTCFAGRGGSPAGFTDQGLLNWVEVEAHYSGRSVALSANGTPIFNYQPDATLRAPVTDPLFGSHQRLPVPTTPRFVDGAGIAGAQTDVQRLITHHNATHPPASVLDDLRANGKYAQRVWKLDTVGSGAARPEGIKVLEQIKANRRWVPSDAELATAAETYRQYTGLTAGGTS